MIRTLLLILVTGAFGTSTVSQDQAGDTPKMPADSYWRVARNCGLNSLFLLLKARGIEGIDYDSLSKVIAIGPKGSSLLDLRSAAYEVGHPVGVYKISPADLETRELPVIAHMDKFSGDFAGTGHLVLITEYDRTNGRVRVFDGVSALPGNVTMERFLQSWTGYIVDIPRMPAWIMLCASIVLGSILGLLPGWILFRGRARAR